MAQEDYIYKYQEGGYKTFDFTPYESNFATSRRDELADRTAKQFSANKTEYDILQRTIGSLQVSSEDQKYIDQLNKDIESGMEGILATGRYDLANFAVSDALTRYMTDTAVKNSVETFETRKKEDQLIAANPNKYKKYYEVPAMVDENGVDWTAADYNNPDKQGAAKLDAQGNPMMKDLRDEWDSGVQGAYLGNSEPALDHILRASTMMKDIARNPKFYPWISAIQTAYGVDEAEAKRMLMSGSAVTGKRVQGLAEALLEEYKSTPEGLQRAQVLSLKLSPQVNELPMPGTGMAVPIHQLNTLEEIDNVMLNDLIAGGEPQIGETINIQNIPQPTGGGDPGAPHRPPDWLSNLTPNKVEAELNKEHKKVEKEIEEGTSEIYDSNGNIKPQKLRQIVAYGKTGPKYEDSDIDDPDSYNKAWERATAALAEKGSTNPLDIPDKYQRAVYINTKFGYLKKDKDGNSISVSDSKFVYEVGKALANAKSVQSTVYKPRTVASQKGSLSGTAQAAQNILNFIEQKGALIYSEALNPNQGLSIEQWDVKMDDDEGKWSGSREGDAMKWLLRALLNTAKGMQRDKDEPQVSIGGLTLRPQSPGATQLTYTDEHDNKRVLYIKTGEVSQIMLTPAAGLIELTTDPLKPQSHILPNIYKDHQLTEAEIEAGVQTIISNEIMSSGEMETFEVAPRYFVYKSVVKDGKVVGKPVSKYSPVSQSTINEFLHSAIEVYRHYGPDESTVLLDQEDDF